MGSPPHPFSLHLMGALGCDDTFFPPPPFSVTPLFLSELSKALRLQYCCFLVFLFGLQYFRVRHRSGLLFSLVVYPSFCGALYVGTKGSLGKVYTLLSCHGLPSSPPLLALVCFQGGPFQVYPSWIFPFVAISIQTFESLIFFASSFRQIAGWSLQLAAPNTLTKPCLCAPVSTFSFPYEW